MPNIVYFAHSYRADDAALNDYFGRLMKSEQLVPSLDPPSVSVNSAKLERHLGFSDAMVAVLTYREGGPSPHIVYEIALAVRARKPVVVFVEDRLPTSVVSGRLLQQRFSRRAYLRQVREHRQALRALRSFLGEQAAPRYQPPGGRRTCLVLGDLEHSSSFREFLDEDLGYDVASPPGAQDLSSTGDEWWELLACVDVVVSLHSGPIQALDAYLLGTVRGAVRPLISASVASDVILVPGIPMEYQTRRWESLDPDLLHPLLAAEFQLYEEDFLDLTDQEAVERYAQQLIELHGQYGPGTREHVTEVVVGDKYEVRGQVGAVGRHAKAENNSFTQMWTETKDQVDLKQLADALERLRQEARSQAVTPEEDDATAEIGKAQRAAEQGDGPSALDHLARAGRWALGLAEKLGIAVATAALKSALGI